MRSTGMKNETQNVLDKQAAVFKTLIDKNKGVAQFDPSKIKAFEVTSDYMMEDITPMG